jgi:hypothetical protein
VDWHLDCCRQRGELFCCGWSTRVCGNQYRAATIFRQSVGQLSGRCCLPSTLQAEQKNRCRPLAQIKFAARTAQRFGQCAVQDSQHAFACAEATNNLACTGPFANTIQQLRNNGHRHIGLDKGLPNVGKPSIEVGGADSPTTRQAAK